MRELLLLCTKNIHFTYKGDIYIEVDGVTMGSTLAPLLANFFMVELERSAIPNPTSISLWRRCVDDTITA